MYCDLRLCFRMAEVEVVLPAFLGEEEGKLMLCPEHWRSLMSAVTQADLHAHALENPLVQ